MKGPDALWTVLARKIAFADHRPRISRNLPPAKRGAVAGPAYRIEYPDQVTIVALTRDASKIVLVRRYRPGVGSDMTGLPSGPVEPAPSPPRLDRPIIASPRIPRPSLPAKAAAQVAAEQAARRALAEQTGYAAVRWICLLKSHPDSSRQSNAGFCFLATELDRVPNPLDVLTARPDEIIEHHLLAALRLLRKGSLTMDVLHAAALWSAGCHIATDHTGYFGALSMQLRRFFAGGDEPSCAEPPMPIAFPASSVGG